MNHKNRLTKLEQRANEQPYSRPRVVEVWGTREDGTHYLIDTWRAFVECNTPVTDQDGSPLLLGGNENEQP
jgi:hypothetical protein